MSTFKLFILFTGISTLGIAYKFDLIHRFGSDVPFWDPWGAEAAVTILPFLENRIDYLGTFWAAHCEHHVGLTRFWSLLITLINGQWDNKVICSINAIFSSLILGLFLVLYRKHLKGIGCIAFATTCIIINTNPLSWENTLGCFQIQFLFSLLGCLLYILLGIQSNKPFTQIICFVVGLINLNTMASCLFAPLAVISTHLLLMIRDNEYKKRLTLAMIHLPMVVISLSVLNYVPGHEILKAQSLSKVLTAFVSICSTPIFPTINIFYLNLICAVIINLPFIIFTYHFFKENIPNDIYARYNFSFGIFLYGSYLATTYSRNLNFDSSRYCDNFYLIILLNSISIILLLYNRIKFNNSNFIWAFWHILVISFHAFTFYNSAPKSLIKKWEIHQKHLYLLSNEIINLDQFNDIPLSELPYIDHHTLSNLISNPKMAEYLPSSIRKEQSIDISNFSKTNNSDILNSIKSSGFYRNINLIDFNSTNFIANLAIGPRKSNRLYRIHYTGTSDLQGSDIKLFSNDEISQELPPKQLIPYQWRQAHFIFPEGNSTLKIGLAEHLSEDSWIAFSNPVEVTNLSWLLRQIRKNSVYIFLFLSFPMITYVSLSFLFKQYKIKIIRLE